MKVIGDSEYGMWRERLSIETTHEQDVACCILEGRGMRFLVDFGYENAIEKAEALLGKPFSVTVH